MSLPVTVPQVLVNGQWLTGLGYWGNLTITHRWPLGAWEMTWEMPLKAYKRFSALKAGRLVEARLGGSAIWAGQLAEPDWDEGTFTAVGACREAEGAPCLTAGGLTTTVPNTAIDQAIADGFIHGTRPASISSAPLVDSDQTDRLTYLGALLDAWQVENDTNWYVNSRREWRAAASPTTPRWLLRPGAGVLGVADTKLAGKIYGRYRTAKGTLATASVGTGAPAVLVDLTKRGPLTLTRAQNVLTGIRNKTGAQTGWTNGLTLTDAQVTTTGGARSSIALVRAGHMVRLLGLRDERGSEASTDIVLGETIWNVAERTMQANPVGLEGRDLASIIEAAGGVLIQ